MIHNSYLCETHSTQATFFCLCNSSPLFLCPVCLPKHEGHDSYPILQFELFQGIGRNSVELKQRNALSRGVEDFLERVVERETADRGKAKALMETLQVYYNLWLDGNHRCFESIITTLKEETAMVLTRPKYRVSYITQKLFDQLKASTPHIEKRFVLIPELETLSTFNDHCQEACSRASKVFQIDYEDEVLQGLTTPSQTNKRRRSLSVTDGGDAQLHLKLDETLLELQVLQANHKTQTEHCTSLQEENANLTLRIQSQSSMVEDYQTTLDRTLNELTEVIQWNSELEARLKEAIFATAPPNESQDPLPDFSTPQSKAALAKFGPFLGQDDENQLTPKGLVTKEDGVYIGQWNVRNQEHGYGMFLCKSGDIYEGHWCNGQKSGKGRYIYNNGNVYIGDFLDDKKAGFGNYYFANGTEYAGTWVNDKMHGVGSLTYGKDSPSSGDRYIGEFLAGELSGLGAYFYRDGEMYVGSWKSGCEHGKGLFGSTAWEIYIGNYEDGERSGNGCCLYSSGQVYQGEWKEGERSGQGRLTQKGKKKEGVWKDDVLRRG